MEKEWIPSPFFLYICTTVENKTQISKPQEVKEEGIEKLFDSIANRYDILNHVLSLGIDHRWKSRVARIVADSGAASVLDVATGTGDIAIRLKRMGVCRVVGGDISEGMLDVGCRKLQRRGLDCKMQVVDAMDMPFGDFEFDGLTCGFGTRNFVDLDAGLREFYRVLSVGGICCIMEYCRGGGSGLWGRFFRFYFKRVLPFIGGLVSRNKSAYKYLPDSVVDFCSSSEFVGRLSAVGFRDVRKIELMGGIVTIFVGYRR